MKKRGTGRETGRERSVERSDALTGLVNALDGVEFPIRLEDLQRAGRDINVRLSAHSANLEAWTLADLLKDVPVDEFSSARHVAEVVRMRYGDMADIYRPGGTGPDTAYGPDDPGEDAGDRAEKAAPEYDGFTAAEEAPEPSDEARRKSGP